MEQAENWDTIESDPAIFTEMIERLGCKGLQVEELFSLDDDCVSQISKPIYGLIFLFKCTEQKEPRQCLTEYDPTLFFAKQVITNACGTQALLSVLLNITERAEIGDTLKEYRQFTLDFPPAIKGISMNNCEAIRSAHHAFSRTRTFELEMAEATEEDDVFHFVSYVPLHGALYELDGLQEGPISHGACEEGSWLDVARPVIMARMAQYQSEEKRFCLMAVTGSRLDAITEEQRMCRPRLAAFVSRAAELGIDLPEDARAFLEAHEIRPAPVSEDESMEIEAMDAHALAELEARAEAASCEAAACLDTLVTHLIPRYRGIAERLADERAKRQRWTDENLRRKHNYVPFIMALLRILAEKGELPRLVEEAVAEEADRMARKAEAKAKAAEAQPKEGEKAE